MADDDIFLVALPESGAALLVWPDGGAVRIESDGSTTQGRSLRPFAAVHHRLDGAEQLFWAYSPLRARSNWSWIAAITCFATAVCCLPGLLPWEFSRSANWSIQYRSNMT